MSSPIYLQRLDIFISSPSDVVAEREAIRRVIEKLNRLHYIRERYILNPLAYENEVPPVMGLGPQEVVDRYMLEPDDCYLLICVMWARMGTEFVDETSGKTFQSGTEYEFTKAYQANLKKGTPLILFYRKTQDAPNADPDQKQRVDTFVKQFEGANPQFKGLYRTYPDLATFEEILFLHIEHMLNEHKPNPNEHFLVEADQRPEIEEEPRRLDAAMPSQCAVGTPTDVWVQVCLPESDGFKAQLPTVAEKPNEIGQENVKEGNLPVAFPVDKTTNKVQPITLSIELHAPHFVINEPIQETILYPQKDSGLIVFVLTPIKPGKRNVVQVKVKSETLEGSSVVLGSALLTTETKPAGVKLLTQMVWTILSLPLSSITQSKPFALEARDFAIREAHHSELKASGDYETLLMLLRDSAPSEILLAMANLQNADLSGVDLSGAGLSGADLRKATFLEATLHQTDLRWANLENARLGRADLQGASLHGANLSGANLQEADLISTSLIGANLSGANLINADLRAANLQEADLRIAYLHGANLQEADLQEADLRKANLQEANLENADLHGANLHGASLIGANLSGANLIRADLHEANLQKADLRMADLHGANLSEAILREADLQEANLQEANLENADLRKANLISADLRKADLRKADLSEAILHQAILQETILAGTILPDGNIWTEDTNMSKFIQPDS